MIKCVLTNKIFMICLTSLLFMYGCEIRKCPFNEISGVSYVDPNSFLIGGRANEKTVFAIWHAWEYQLISSYQSELNNNFIHWQGTMIVPNFTPESNEKNLEWECTTVNGDEGPVMIDGREYRLEDGPLFLVERENGRFVVTQLHIDISNRQYPSDFEELIEVNSTVKEFIDKTRNQ